MTARILTTISLFLFLTQAAFAVQVYRIDPAPLMTTSGNVPIGGFPTLYAVANATIQLCSDSACVTSATAFTDGTGTTACPINAPVTLPGTTLCVSASGPQGQFGFWLIPGTYYFKVTTPNGQSFGPYPISSPTLGVTTISPNFTVISAASNASTITLTPSNSGLDTIAEGITGTGTHFPLALETVGQTVYVTMNTSQPAPSIPSDAYKAFMFEGIDGNLTDFVLDNYGGDRAAFVGRSALGTSVNPTALLSGSHITAIDGRGYFGTGYSGPRAAITFTAGENWSATNQGAIIQFTTTPLASTTSQLTAEIGSVGSLVSGFILGNGITTSDVSATNVFETVGNNTGFIAAGASANASALSMTIVNGSYASIASNKTNSGSYLPLAFFTNGVQNLTLMNSNPPQLLLNGTSTDATGSPYYIALGNGAGFTAAGATANASTLSMTIVNGTAAEITASKTGTGTNLPLAFFTGGSQQMGLATTGSWTLNSAGPHAVGAATDPRAQLYLAGSWSGGTSAFGILQLLTLAPSAGNDAYSTYIDSAFTKAGSGTHALFAGLRVNISGITAGASTLTDVAGIDVQPFSGSGAITATGMRISAPTGATTNNWAMDVLTGNMILGGPTTDLNLAGETAIALIGSTSGIAAATAASNASVMSLSVVSGQSVSFAANKTGSGTYLPITFAVNGAEAARIVIGSGTGTGNLFLGGTSTDLSLPNVNDYVAFGSGSGFVAATATSNASVLSLSVVSGLYTSWGSNKTGSGSYLPIEFFTNGAAAAIIDTAQRMGPAGLAAATSSTLCYNTTVDSGFDVMAVCSSLRQLKTNITPLPSTLSKVLALNPVAFTEIATGLFHYGLIAEDVNAVDPVLSSFYGTDAQGNPKLSGYDIWGMNAINIKAIQELHQDVANLEKLSVNCTGISPMRSCTLTYDDQGTPVIFTTVVH